MDSVEEMVKLAKEGGIEVWHTPDGEAWVTFHIGGAVEHQPLRSGFLEHWLFGAYRHRFGVEPTPEVIRETLEALKKTRRAAPVWD